MRDSSRHKFGDCRTMPEFLLQLHPLWASKLTAVKRTSLRRRLTNTVHLPSSIAHQCTARNDIAGVWPCAKQGHLGAHGHSQNSCAGESPGGSSALRIAGLLLGSPQHQRQRRGLFDFDRHVVELDALVVHFEDAVADFDGMLRMLRVVRGHDAFLHIRDEDLVHIRGALGAVQCHAQGLSAGPPELDLEQMTPLGGDVPEGALPKRLNHLRVGRLAVDLNDQIAGIHAQVPGCLGIVGLQKTIGDLRDGEELVAHNCELEAEVNLVRAQGRRRGASHGSAEQAACLFREGQDHELRRGAGAGGGGGLQEDLVGRVGVHGLGLADAGARVALIGAGRGE
mmetsp:Transcript_104263/g.336120  ORF Transcript_104263/g.336120 Transcript_104263/m.336120 type:complete len:339 (+) Transcript_104263:195-1211(+)